MKHRKTVGIGRSCFNCHKTLDSLPHEFFLKLAKVLPLLVTAVETLMQGRSISHDEDI